VIFNPVLVYTNIRQGWNIDELLEVMWDRLKLVRVYTKPKGKTPDYTSPVVLRSQHCTVEDFCHSIHKTIVEQFKHAIVYGRSVKHQPQRVGLSHELADEDISKHGPRLPLSKCELRTNISCSNDHQEMISCSKWRMKRGLFHKIGSCRRKRCTLF
jgi:TGS domain